MNWETNYDKLNVTYVGMQDMGNGKQVPMFNDEVTKSSFLVTENETLEDAVMRVRKRFGVV